MVLKRATEEEEEKKLKGPPCAREKLDLVSTQVRKLEALANFDSQPFGLHSGIEPSRAHLLD
jgi:hypothetical protein